MVRQRMSMEQQVQNLNLRASEALQKARKTAIMMAMRNRPQLTIDPLWEKLQSLGLSPEDLATPGGGAKSAQARATEERKRVSAEGSVAKRQKVEEDVAAECGVAEAVDPISDKSGTLDQLSLVSLRDTLLPGLGEATLSAPNLRSIKDREHASKSGLLRYLEFCTGLSGDFALVGKLRCMVQLQTFCKDRSVARGRRGIGLEVPCHWPTCGVYEILGDGYLADGGLEIRQRFCGETIKVAKDPLSQVGPSLPVWFVQGIRA